jgi:hypothetical protein
MNSTVDEPVSDLPIESCESKELDHLGLVAGMYEELEIGQGNLRFPESTSTSIKTLSSEKSPSDKLLKPWFSMD